ncbi:MAG: carboxypeptidase regulatory-like domain-containing protein [Acidobacteriota bacterium]
MSRKWVLIAVFVLLAAPALAQQQYGSIAGTVVDNQQQPLPGVTVTLSGPAMQGTRVAVTDAQGRFRFVPVPPGKDYTLKFELSGFNTLEQTGIIVNLGKETPIVAEMSLSQFAEAITVTAEKIVVDTSKSTVDTTVDWTLVDTLATNRNFQTMMQMAPGVKAGNNPYVHGNSNDSNSYLIDGVETTDPRTNTWGTAINWDTIQEAQIQTAAFAAEYGRATGGIVNLVTKSGGNNLSFTARWVQQDVDWSARGGIEKETGQKKPLTSSDEKRPSFTLGGPFVKDMLWFYFAYEKRDNHRSFGRYATIQDAVSKTQTTGRTNYVGHYFSGKLTYQINPSHNLVGFYNEDPITLDPLRGGWTGPNYNKSAEQQQYQGGNNASLQWYGVLSPNVFAEAKYQYHRQELNVTPLYGGFGQTPYMYDLTAAYYYGAAYYDYRSKRDRDGLNLAVSYYLDTATGTHQFKAGAELLWLKPKVGRIYNPAGYYQTRNLGQTPYRRYLWFDQVRFNETKQDYQGIYVQDQWKVGKATFNIGVRAEATKLRQNTDDEVLKFDFSDMIAPRLGFAYDLNGDALRVSLGRFYTLASNYIADYFNVIPTHQQRWDWNGTCAVDGRNVWEYPDSCWRLRYDVPTAAGGTTIDPNLDPAYQDEFVAGYEKLINPQFAASVNYVYRKVKKTIDWYDPEDDGKGIITNVPKTGKNWSEYQAIEAALRKRFGPDGFQFIAAYTYVFDQKNWAANWWNALPGAFIGPYSELSRWYGRAESKHEVKFNGSYTFPFKTIVGLSLFWQDGIYYTPTGTTPDGYSYPLAERGSKKFGNLWEGDIHVEQPFSFKGVRFAAYVDLFNMFNNQFRTARYTRQCSVYDPSTGSCTPDSAYFRPTAWQAPRRLQIGFKIEY